MQADMRHTRVIAATVMMIVATVAPALGSHGWRPLYTAAVATTPPTIDGRIDDPCWQTATAVGPFVLIGGEASPTQDTRACVAYDDRALYLAFECLEDRMADLVAQRTARDSDVWHDDCVEVFLAPPRDAEYFHLAVNAAGAQYDERGALDPAGWNGDWQSAVGRGPDRWSAEIAIPWASLGARVPALLEAWTFNLGREEQPHRELSEISVTTGSFHDREHFADIVFGGPEAQCASVVSLGGRFLGRHMAEVRVRNEADRRARLTLWADVPGLRQARVAADVPAETSQVVLVPYEVFAEGNLSLMLNVADSAGRGVLRSTPVSFSIEPNQARLKQILQALDRLDAPAAKQGLTAVLSRTKADAHRLLATAGDRKRWAAGDRDGWERLGGLVERLDVRSNRLRLQSLSRDPDAGYAVGVESPLRKLRPDAPYLGPVGPAAEIWLCRNEYEPIQVVVAALDRPLRNVQARVSDLVGPDGARIRQPHIALNLVDFVRTRKPAYPVDYVGWYPDPLIDLKPFDVKADAFQPIWVTVDCPATLPGGDYTGQIIVKPDNAGESRLPLTAHVWSFELPRETHLKTAFALSEGAIAAWYGYDRLPDDVRLRYYDFLLQHRINPTNIYSSTPVPAAQDMAFCIRRGLNAFNIKCFGYAATPEKRRADVEQVRSYVEFLKQQGWFGGAYIYGFDEIRPADYPKLREVYDMIGEAVPSLPRACTVVPNPDLKGYVDIWVPLTAAYDHAAAQQYRRAGDEVWWYVCCGPRHPYANWFIDYPATDPRLLFWMNWKYGVNGFLYYCVNRWHSNRWIARPPNDVIPDDDPAVRAAIAAGKRWPEVPWNTFTYSNFNGDGQLIYPGPDGKPLSSVRLECIRDGIEDYEYFCLLAELTAALEGPDRYYHMVQRAKDLLAVDPRVVRSLTDYTTDPDLVHEARVTLGSHIDSMWRALGR
jgi:hypothetical protein